MKHRAFRLSLIALIILMCVGCLQTEGLGSRLADYPHEPVEKELPADPEHSESVEFSLPPAAVQPVSLPDTSQPVNEFSSTIKGSRALSSISEIPEGVPNGTSDVQEPKISSKGLNVTTQEAPAEKSNSSDIEQSATTSRYDEYQEELPAESIIGEPIKGNPPMGIVILITFFLLVVTAALISSRISLYKKGREGRERDTSLYNLEQKLHAAEQELNRNEFTVRKLQEKMTSLNIHDIEAAKERMAVLHSQTEVIEMELISLQAQRIELDSEKDTLEGQVNKLEGRIEKQKIMLSRSKELYSAVENAVKRFHAINIPREYYLPLQTKVLKEIDEFAPTVMLKLNCMNYQDLRKEFRINQKQIDGLLEDYAQRYTTKANQAIYKLMVLSLRSELQNILYNLKYEKLENARTQVKTLVSKYLVVSAEGNQAIAGTMRRFIGELEHLFDNAVRIEYEYYIKREQVRQEQLALRQQMREEAEERKRLEEQRKQIALEEEKYLAEIEKVEALLEDEDLEESRRSEIQAKLDTLQHHLDSVEEKKEEITKLQNGKAGNVYIISNLGSFGDNVFKIGMTRRLDPQDRVNELGSASVPFTFDVHSFIFSEDAVGLENEMHRRLHEKRVNKINLRKEFFEVTLDELEALVLEVNPTAEFNRTMLAEDYHQSLSLAAEGVNLPESDNSMPEQDDDNHVS